MKNSQVSLSRGEKILLSLYKISGKSRKSIRYEDIVVEAFKTYPEDFHLKGYPEYPESGDLVHKPLYDYKKKGVVVAGNKMFALTEKGLVAVEKLKDAIAGRSVANTERLTRDIEKEITRVTNTQGFALFLKGEESQLVDTDFYDYLGVTVRTSRNDFIGRLHTLTEVVKSTEGAKNAIFKNVAQYHQLMTAKFVDIIKYKEEH